MNKVFTSDEQRTILEHNNPNIVLWSVWAAKETAYKAISRLYPAVSSIPEHYPVRLFSKYGSLPETGIVHTPCEPVSVSFFISRDTIHCVGTTPGNDTDSIMWDVRVICRRQFSPGDQSERVRTLAAEMIARYTEKDPKSIEIIRTQGHRGLGPPAVYIGKERAAIDISLSHDGRFVACAFQASNNSIH